MKTYRTNGAIGALLDEYEKAIIELKVLLGTVSAAELVTIVDEQTKDKDCRSIQTILTHVVRAGYCYVVEIRNKMGERIDWIKNQTLLSTADYQKALDDMFAFNEELFEDYPDIQIEENDPAKKIVVRWGQIYDVEQLLEHAIVHILRHRRQIERFLIELRKG